MILAVFYDAFKTQKSFRPSDHPASISVSQKRLCSVTGFSSRNVVRALSELNNDGRFIRKSAERTRQEDGRLGLNGYALMHPHRGVPLLGLGKNLLLSNQIAYLTFPKALITAKGKRWSMKNWSTSEASVYFACAFFANSARSASFEVRTGDLVRASGLTLTTFKEAFPALAETRLLDLQGDARLKGGSLKGSLKVEMFDPYTGELPVPADANDEDRPSNYRINGGSLDLNCGTADELEALLRNAGYDGPLTRTGDDVLVCCPFHDDRMPSCSVSFTKSCFFCYGCKATGSRFQLVQKLRSQTDADEATLLYVPPDAKAEAQYDYRDRSGRLVKMVVRYPAKVFRQWRPGSGGRVYSTRGVVPTLYREELLDSSDFVCCFEGERDCDAFNDLHPQSLDLRFVTAVTSGSANSWRPEFADKLKGKRVVVATDDDEAGDSYGDTIERSLRDAGIESRRVRWSGTGCKDFEEALRFYEPSELLLRLLGPEWAQEVLLEGDRLIPDLTECQRPHSITIFQDELISV